MKEELCKNLSEKEAQEMLEKWTKAYNERTTGMRWIKVPENVCKLIEEYNDKDANQCNTQYTLDAFKTLADCMIVGTIDDAQAKTIMWALTEIKKVIDILSYKN